MKRIIFLLAMLFSGFIWSQTIPENAKVSKYGSGWVCNKGFYKSGQQCLNVEVPNNGKLNYAGSGWVCNKGFYKSGLQCLNVVIPKNGKLNYAGSGWACVDGYKKSANSCIKMTPQEVQEQAELKKAYLADIKKREARGFCETEYKTGAEVCIKPISTDLDCNENYSGNYYDSCEVSLTYKYETDYRGSAYLDLNVECEVEVEYEGKNTYGLRSDSDSERSSHSLYADDFGRKDIVFDFSFSYFDEVNNVKISDATCKISSVDMY
nr:hypothetical protein [Shewanella sp. 10N.286.48.B5]PMH85914.1 hypothetical protein BCU57_12825 [Shewanella sp. 10N.286.48.B5]